MEPKYKCLTCGKKFYRKEKYKKHCFVCAQKKYLCKLCGCSLRFLDSVKRHNARLHPGESSLDTLQIVQDRKQVQNNDVQMEVTAENTTTPARDEQGQPTTANPSSKVDVSGG